MQTKTSFHYHDNPCIDYFFLKKAKKKLPELIYKKVLTPVLIISLF